MTSLRQVPAGLAAAASAFTAAADAPMARLRPDGKGYRWIPLNDTADPAVER